MQQNLLGSSAIVALLNTYVFEPKKNKLKYIFDEKKHVYEAIIIFGLMVLYPNESRDTQGVARYDIRNFSDEKITERGIIELEMSISKLTLISKNNDVVEKTKKFIKSQNEVTFNELVQVLKKDLYK